MALPIAKNVISARPASNCALSAERALSAPETTSVKAVPIRRLATRSVWLALLIEVPIVQVVTSVILKPYRGVRNVAIASPARIYVMDAALIWERDSSASSVRRKERGTVLSAEGAISRFKAGAKSAYGA